MTGPIQFPSIDHLSEWPDLEDLMCLYLERFGHTDTVYPPEKQLEDVIIASGAVIVCQRAGGGANESGVDMAPVVVAVTAKSRRQSWSVMNKIRLAVKVAEKGVTVDGKLIDGMSEAGDLQLVSSLNQDVREVQLTFMLRARRPRTP